MVIYSPSFTQMQNKTRAPIALKDIAVVGLMVAMIEVAKAAMSFLPNIELTSFLLIVYTLVFGAKTLLAVPVFILIEGAIYGFGIWWVMYLYAWPLLVFVTLLFRKKDSVWFFSIESGVFGLLFGALCAIPYFFIGAADSSVQSGINMAVTWWIAGIPWDIGHCISNFVFMLVLYYPVRKVLKRCYCILYTSEN